MIRLRLTLESMMLILELGMIADIDNLVFSNSTSRCSHRPFPKSCMMGKSVDRGKESRGKMEEDSVLCFNKNNSMIFLYMNL